MVTIKELLAQIKSLQKQLKTLKVTNSDSTTFKSSSVNEQFYKELSEAHQSGIKVINRGQEKKIELSFEDSLLSEDIGNVLSDLNEYEIEIVDRQKIKEQEEIVRRKYKDKLIPGGAVGGIPPDGWIYLAAYHSLVWVFKWSLKHILDDTDQALWDKFKEKWINLYGLLVNKKSGAKNEFTVVASYKIFENDLPTILFIFPMGIPEIEMKKEIDRMADIFKKTVDDYIKGDKGFSVFEFTYDLSTKKWNLKTQNKF